MKTNLNRVLLWITAALVLTCGAWLAQAPPAGQYQTESCSSSSDKPDNNSPAVVDDFAVEDDSNQTQQHDQSAATPKNPSSDLQRAGHIVAKTTSANVLLSDLSSTQGRAPPQRTS